MLGSINAGKVGSTLVFHVAAPPARRAPRRRRALFERLDRERTWCQLEASDVEMRRRQRPHRQPTRQTRPRRRPSRTAGTRRSRPCPSDWTDLLCELEIDSSALLDRTALLCAPLNPTRAGSRLAFTFRCSGRSGYGVSPSMARRCFERLDEDGIAGTTRVLRVLSDTDNVDTQGPVWLVGGKTL